MSHENGIKQILVVDGEHEMLTLYDVILKGLGYNILKASNGPQALKLL